MGEVGRGGQEGGRVGKRIGERNAGFDSPTRESKAVMKHFNGTVCKQLNKLVPVHLVSQ